MTSQSQKMPRPARAQLVTSLYADSAFNAIPRDLGITFHRTVYRYRLSLIPYGDDEWSDGQNSMSIALINGEGYISTALLEPNSPFPVY